MTKKYRQDKLKKASDSVEEMKMYQSMEQR